MINLLQKKIVNTAVSLLNVGAFADSIFQTHHFNSTVFDHSVHVALVCAAIGHFLLKHNIHFSMDEMIRGALLHDIGIVEARKKPIKELGHCLAVYHPLKSAELAETSVKNLTAKERNIIETHMFPISLHMPKCKEAWLITIVDKIVTFKELCGYLCPLRREIFRRAISSHDAPAINK